MGPTTSRGGTFVVSLDLELYWGVRDKRDPEQYRMHVEGTRRVVPRLLDLFRKYEVHATWATVGFVFFDTLADLVGHLPRSRPAYADRRLSPYAYLSALDGRDLDLFHFAPDLVRRIAGTAHQELATHTFSHYYCLAAGQTPEAFRDDVDAALRVARERFGRELVSLVFPRNQTNEAYLNVCRDAGIRAYRGNERGWLYAPRGVRRDSRLRRALRLVDAYVDLSGSHTYPLEPRSAFPVNVPSSRFLRPYSPMLRVLEPLRFRRIEAALEDAARRDRVFHLWWHPENFAVHPEENLAFLERVLVAFSSLRTASGMRSASMGEIARSGLGAPAR